MNVWDRLFKRSSQEIRAPNQLRDTLLAAQSAGNKKLLVQLCKEHQNDIVRDFRAWQNVPECIRKDSAAMQRYFDGLLAVAEILANVLGHSEPLAALIGSGDENPLHKWDEALSRVRRLMDNLQYRDATKSLEMIVEEFESLHGSGRDLYLAVTYGDLAKCYLHCAEAAKALPAADAALRLCNKVGDTKGMANYAHGLYEINRYLGRGERAADFAQLLAEMLEAGGRHREAARYRKRAHLSLGGEPLNRVVVEVGDEQFELEEAPKLDHGTMRFGYQRNRQTLHPAEVLTERGKRLTQSGRYEEGLAALRDAAQADAYDPNPHYQAGLCLLHLRRYREAVRSYEATETLAPGWFHCRAELWLAQQLAAGVVDHETFLTLRVLEDDKEMGSDEKVCLAERALGRADRLAVLYLHYGRNLQATQRQIQALAAYRRGLNCSQEPQVRARLLVNLALLDANVTEKRCCLEEVAETKGDLIAAATAFLILRDMPPKVH